MRSTIPLLTILILLIASIPATAQTDLLEQGRSLEVTVEPFPNPIPPLSDPASANVTVRVPCEDAGTPGQPNTVLLEVASKPDWVEANVTPKAVEPDVEACETDANATVPANATLTVRTTSDAPAFTSEPIVVTARLEASNRSGTGAVPVEAGFFILLSANTHKSVIAAEPRAHLKVPVTIHNLGNDAVTVSVDIVRSDGLKVAKPSPTRLESLQQGSTDNTVTIPLSLVTPYRNGYTNAKDTLELTITAEHHERPDLGTFNTSTTLLVTTKGWDVPGPGALATGLAALAGAVLLPRRRPT